MLFRNAARSLKSSQRQLLFQSLSYEKSATLRQSCYNTFNAAKYSTISSEKTGVYDDSEFLDEFGNFEIVDFESSLNKITNDFLLAHGDKPIEQKALDKYWGLIIKDYESKCKFTDIESYQMETALLEHYYKFVSNTSTSNLLASDILSRYINILTMIKAGSIRDFSITKGTMNLFENEEYVNEMNLSVNIRFTNVFECILKIMNFVPMTEKSQDIPVHFFYIVYLRFMNELPEHVDPAMKDKYMKVVKFCFNEFSKSKDASISTVLNAAVKQYQNIQFSSLSSQTDVDDNIESTRALQKCIIYRILMTQDDKIISNVWDSINFRTGYYKNNVIENWNVFIEQMEKIFINDNTPMTESMKIYTASHLLAVLTEDLVTFSEVKIPEGESLISRLKALIK